MGAVRGRHEASGWKLASGFQGVQWASTSERGLGGAAGGGGGENAGGRVGEGGLVTTRLGLGNYNPAIAPAYRATSDPSKRVAWEFGWRQRPAGEARGAVTTASAPPLPQGGRRGCAGGRGGRELERARGGHLGSCPSPLRACHCAQGNSTAAQQPPSLWKAVNLVSIFAAILLCTTRCLWLSWGPYLGVQSSYHPLYPPLPGGTFDDAKISAREEPR